MKKITKVSTAILVLVLCLSMFIQANADWGKSKPPTNTNISTASQEKRDWDKIVDKKGNLIGMKEFDTTTKCYKGASSFTSQACNVYTVNHSSKKITIKFNANYWNVDKGDWDYVERAHGETLDPTYVKKKVKKQSTDVIELKSKGKDYYHYGKAIKGYTSIGIGGQWYFKKGKNK